MPIQSFATFTKWVARENISVPQHFYDALLPVKDDDAQVREVGTKLVGEMCRKILAAPEGISGLHIYTLNLQVGARMLLEEVGLEADIEKVSPLPWTPVSLSLLLFGVGKRCMCRLDGGAESAWHGRREERTKLTSCCVPSRKTSPSRRTDEPNPFDLSFVSHSLSLPQPSLH